MSYTIIIEKKAQKEAEPIPAKNRAAIDKAISSLSFNPSPVGSKKLTDKEGYRIRIGSYRVLYMIDHKTKLVVIYRIKIRSKHTYS